DITPSLPAPIFKPGRDSRPSAKWPNGRKGIVQLQAADYLAYEIGKFARDHQLIMSGSRNFRMSLGMLPENKVKQMFFSTERLKHVCSKMMRLKRRQP